MADERQRLELLKLRYEIEALKAEHSLPDFDQPPIEPAPVAQAANRESDLARFHGGSEPSRGSR
jgi:hypothetical protein